MPLHREVRVHAKNIQLEVIIPKEKVWEFAEAFGIAFAEDDSQSGNKHIKAVDSYFEHPNGWHVFVTVCRFDEKKFLYFLGDFAKDRDLTHPNFFEDGI
jgi:hypothetical protein